jgi:hypothetical protein
VKLFVLCALAALFVVGCEKKEEPAATAPPAPSAQAKPTAELPRPPVGIAPAEPPADEDDLATAEDFEDAAEQEISATNVDSEVDKLEKEIAE